MRLHMDYEDFLKNNTKFESWYGKSDYDTVDFFSDFKKSEPFHLNSPYMSNPLKGAASDDVLVFTEYGKSDKVNSPAHYTRGSQEAIDIIEESIQDAPDVKSGMLQAQALKYLLRMWLKDDPKQDAEKARWYLTRLIDSL